jgi:hypothetical protein
MTHAHDKTLLARFAFADPDAKDPLHDLGCEYIALEENALKLLNMIKYVPDDVGKEITSDSLYFETDSGLRVPFAGKFKYRITEIDRKVRSHVESILTKGQDQYMVTIGFLDVDTSWTVRHRRVGKDSANEKYPDLDDWLDYRGRIVTEVKISPIGIGDLVRQMNLYREHVEMTHQRGDARAQFFVAAAFDVNDYFQSALNREGIHLVRLGDNFTTWAAKQSTSSVSRVTEI